MQTAAVLVATVAVVVVGLMVGVELAVAVFVNPIFDRLRNDGGVAARSDGARVLGRVVPFWYFGSIIAAAAWAAQSWGEPRAGAIVVAAALLVAAVLMLILVLVPINSRVARWSDGAVPADWKQQVNRWDRLHYVRVAGLVAAFVLLVAACSL